MNTLKFQTTIDSEEKLEKAGHLIGNLSNIAEWTADIHSLYHVLTVRGVNIHVSDIVKVLQDGGFTVTPLYEE